MASIRRTLSPQRGRMYQNGGSDIPELFHTPSHKLFSHGKTTLSPIKRFIAAPFLLVNYPRKGNHLKRSLFNCLIFFVLGILLGMVPFDFMMDVKNRDLVNRFPTAVNTSEVNGEGESVGVVEELVDSTKLKTSVIGFRNQINHILDSTLADKLLIVVTPTYNRAFQAYYLNRLGQALRLLKPPVLWIVVEMKVASLETSNLLRNLGVVYRHLVCTKPSTSVKDKGVHQRNTALEHIEMHKLDGIVYFADDDNVYSLELFENIRNISRFGTWLVGMMAQSKNKAIIEGPVCSANQVIGWHTNEKSKSLRRFHIDMSGFAFNSTILWDPNRWHRPSLDPIRQMDTVKEGFQEITFIEQIVEDESQMEGIPQGCSRIMNWHAGYQEDRILRDNLN